MRNPDPSKRTDVKQPKTSSNSVGSEGQSVHKDTNYFKNSECFSILLNANVLMKMTFKRLAQFSMSLISNFPHNLLLTPPAYHFSTSMTHMHVVRPQSLDASQAKHDGLSLAKAVHSGPISQKCFSTIVLQTQPQKQCTCSN